MKRRWSWSWRAGGWSATSNWGCTMFSSLEFFIIEAFRSFRRSALMSSGGDRHHHRLSDHLRLVLAINNEPGQRGRHGLLPARPRCLHDPGPVLRRTPARSRSASQKFPGSKKWSSLRKPRPGRNSKRISAANWRSTTFCTTIPCRTPCRERGRPISCRWWPNRSPISALSTRSATAAG